MSIVLSHRLFKVLWLLVLAAIVFANYQVFMVVPNEKFMGPVQRIFYFHVGSAIACYISFAIVFAASIFYLVKKKKIFDIINVSAAEVGFLFCTIVLVSGMIWGKAAWNVWFRFEPRLISFLLIWLIFLAFNLLRIFADSERMSSHTAILGIVGAVSVPITVYSVKLLPQMVQLHPQVIEKSGLAPIMMQTLLYTTIALIVFQFFLIILRVRLEVLQNGS